MSEDARSGSALSSIDKAFIILRAFGVDDANGVGITELARRTELSKATVHRVLAQLRANGAVIKAGDRYRVGRVLGDQVGAAEGGRRELVTETLTPFLAALFERTRQTVHLAYLDGADAVYANKLFSVTGISAPSRIGGRVPGYTTAVGKAMMAYDEDAVELAISRGLVAWTPFSVADPDRLRSELAVVRDTGLAYEVEESALGLTCVAAPVWGRGKVPVAAMSVSGSVDAFSPKDHAQTLLAICAKAGEAYRRRE